MRMLILAVPLVALGLSACSRNPDTPAGRAADARHESFEEIGDQFKTITDQIKKSEPDFAKIRTAASGIADKAPKVTSWFPAGSGPDDGIKTDALQTVWTKPDEFQAAAAKFVEESAAFNTLVQGTDVAAIGQGVAALGAACKGCHDKFRKPE